MNIVQNQELNIVFFANNGGVPVDGMIGTDIEVRIWKPGLTEWDQYYLRPESIAEGELIVLGEGYYVIKVKADATDTIGALAVEISGSIFSDQLFHYWVDADPVGSCSQPDKCVVSGNIRDIGGNPGKGQHIRVYTVNMPQAAGQSILTSDPVETQPDAYGNFSLALIRGETVIMEIERTGIRQQFEVPDQATALVIDLLPPLP